MKKSPEEYFSGQNFSVDPPGTGEFTPAELAFMEKYMGVDKPDILGQLGLPFIAPKSGERGPAPKEPKSVQPADLPLKAARPETLPQAVPAPEQALPRPAGLAPEPQRDAVAKGGTAPPEPSLEELLRDEAEIQMVGFFIGGQEFTIPTMLVQEVIRYLPVAKLPAAPAFVPGVINLRGRITPLLDLRAVLGVNSPRKEEDKFIIVCRCKGLQVGMIIERVHTMYRVSQRDIEWGIEAYMGVNAEYIAGLFKLREQLVSIVSVDRVVDGILK